MITKTELARSKTRDGTIGEFVFNKSDNKFELLRLRRDKTSPNSLSTAINVVNAIKHPVDLEIIKKFARVDKLNQNGLKDLLKYMTKSQKLRCMLNNKMIDLFNIQFKNQINKLLNEFKQNNGYELEIRFGIIEPTRFQTNLPFNLYKQVIDVLSLLYKNSKFEYSVFYDYYSRDIRTRYLYLKI